MEVAQELSKAKGKIRRVPWLMAQQQSAEWWGGEHHSPQ